MLVAACGTQFEVSDEPASTVATTVGSSSTSTTSTGGGPCFREDCAVDYPCAYPAECDPNAPWILRLLYDVHCEVDCGTPCCTGASCGWDDIDCSEEGSACVATGYFSFEMDASCVPLEDACGGPRGWQCPIGEFCDYGMQGDGWGGWIGPHLSPCEAAEGTMYGRCLPMPEVSSCDAEVEAPVCGCDQVTYANDCLRRAAGIPLMFPYACPAG